MLAARALTKLGRSSRESPYTALSSVEAICCNSFRSDPSIPTEYLVVETTAAASMASRASWILPGPFDAPSLVKTNTLLSLFTSYVIPPNISVPFSMAFSEYVPPPNCTTPSTRLLISSLDFPNPNGISTTAEEAYCRSPTAVLVTSRRSTTVLMNSSSSTDPDASNANTRLTRLKLKRLAQLDKQFPPGQNFKNISLLELHCLPFQQQPILMQSDLVAALLPQLLCGLHTIFSCEGPALTNPRTWLGDGVAVKRMDIALAMETSTEEMRTANGDFIFTKNLKT